MTSPVAESVSRRLTVVSAGLSNLSSTRLLADRLTQTTVSTLNDEGISVDTTVIEIRQHAMAITDLLLHGSASPELDEAVAALSGADGAIIATPIFAGSYSGLLKSFFDVIEPGVLAGLPVILSATGGSERHALALDHALRPLLTYHRAVAVPTGLYAAESDWAVGSALSARIQRAAGELTALMRDSTRGAQRWNPPVTAGSDRATSL